MRTGNQQQRAAAALELALLKPGAPLLDVTAPTHRQLGAKAQMPSSEDYTVVWAGIYRRLPDADLEDEDETPLERRARRAGLQIWRDTFEVDPVRGDIPCVLVGRQVALLGYKEGRTRFATTSARLTTMLRRVSVRLRSIGIQTAPRLHVLVHIEDGE
jgi:hypothetical protein